MIKAPETYSQQLERMFYGDPRFSERSVKTVTFQVTEDCTLRCTYCYQPVKYSHYMDFNTAKRAVDVLFEMANDPESVLSYQKTGAIIIDFIGGEPFLAIDLITEIIDYIEQRLLETNSPWLLFHRYSFSSNGTLYFDDRVQALIKKYSDLLSIAITVDGNKALHDSCRLFPDGRGSYDIAIKAALDIKDRFNSKSTKITLSPENISQLSDAILNMWSLGFNYVHANCCFEEGWELTHAQIFYKELKALANHILDNALWEECGTSLFAEDIFTPYTEDNDQNYCGGTGDMIAVDYRGIFYPCIRYMPSSLNGEQPPLIIGSIERGIYKTEEDRQVLKELKAITRSSQSTEECNNCPIAGGCAWCSGYNYQKFGTANKRATFICVMHKARALANLYFWAKYYAKCPSEEVRFENHLTDKIALEIISEEEWMNLQNQWGNLHKKL